MKTGVQMHNVAVAGLVIAGFAVLFMSIVVSPLILGGTAAAVVLVVAIVRLGFLTTAVSTGLIAMVLSAFLGRYVSAANAMNSVGTGIVIAVGILMLPYVRLPKSVAVPGLLFLGLTSISSISWATASPEYAIRGWISLAAAPFAVIAVAGVIQRTKETNPTKVSTTRNTIIVTLIGVTALNLALGLKQSLLGMDAAETRSAVEGDSTYLVGEQIRIMGGFMSNQDMGLFLACFSPAALVLGLTLTGRAGKWAYAFSALLYMTTFLSLTRTALIASVSVGILAVVFIGGGSVVARLLKNVLLAAAGLAIIWFVLASLEVTRVDDAITRGLTLFDLSSDGSFNSRADATLPIAWRAFEENIFGVGIGSAGPVSQQFSHIAPMGYLNADNGYLNVAIQLGILGAVAFVWFLFALVTWLVKIRSPWALTSAAALLSLVVAMLTAGYWSLLTPICVISALVGLGASELIKARMRNIPLKETAISTAPLG